PSVINNGQPFNEKLYLTLLLSYKTDGSIKQAADTLAAIRTLTINSTDFSEQTAREMAKHQPERLQLQVNQASWKLIKNFLESTTIETNKAPSFVVANGEVELRTETVVPMLQYVTEERREAVK